MSVSIHIDCDGDGCRERWNAANTNEERRLATAYVNGADWIGLDLTEPPAVMVEGELALPDGWRTVDDFTYPNGARFLCPACSGVPLGRGA